MRPAALGAGAALAGLIVGAATVMADDGGRVCYRLTGALPMTIGLGLGGDAPVLVTSVRPELAAVRVREGTDDAHPGRAIGLGLYGELSALGDEGALGGGGFLVLARGRLGVAPSLGVATGAGGTATVGGLFLGLYDVEDEPHRSFASGLRGELRRQGDVSIVMVSLQVDLVLVGTLAAGLADLVGR